MIFFKYKYGKFLTIMDEYIAGKYNVQNNLCIYGVFAIFNLYYLRFQLCLKLCVFLFLVLYFLITFYIKYKKSKLSFTGECYYLVFFGIFIIFSWFYGFLWHFCFGFYIFASISYIFSLIKYKLMKYAEI